MPTQVVDISSQIDQYGLETVGGTSSSTFGGQTVALPKSKGPAYMASNGQINVQLSHAGLSTATTGAETTIAQYSIPAGSFDIVGRGVMIEAWGTATFASGTAVAKLYFGSVGTTVGTLATTNFWWAAITIWKDGSSSQNGFFQSTVSTTHQGTSALSQTETDTAAIIVKVTANQSAVANAIKVNGFVVSGFN